MNNRLIISACLGFITLGVLLSGCALKRPLSDPEMDIAAKKIADSAAAFNQQILTSKGLGWAVIETQEQTARYRIAWAARFPDKIRITFMLMGLPVETIVANGQTTVFFSHTGEHARHTDASTNLNLESYVHVPVCLNEIVAILLGRLPIKAFDDAHFSTSETTGSAIFLRQKYKGPVQKLFIESDHQITRIQSTNMTGTSLYEIAITDFTSFDFGPVPSRVTIMDNKNQKVVLIITKFVVNPAIKESVFVLTDQG